jgi:chaperonin GroEL (HSP60 family)
MPTPEQMGWVDVYETVDFDGVRMTVLRQLVAGDPGFEKSGQRGDGKGENTPTATILLRGSPGNELDFRESAIDDGMSLIRSLLRDRRLVPGAGETELELARRVDVFGSKIKGELQDVVKRFAMALQVIPRTLAENAAVWEREGNKVVDPFEGKSEVTDRDREAESPSDGTILADSNSLPYPILDSLATKRKAIENAMGATASVLNIDSDIMSRQRKSSDIKMPQPHRTRITYEFRGTTPSTLLGTILDTTVSPIVAIPFCVLMTFITLQLLPKVP